MIKNKKNLLLTIPLTATIVPSIANSIQIDEVKTNEISNYNLTTIPNNVEYVVAAIKKKLKDKKIKFYNIDDWNNLENTKDAVLTQTVNIIKQGGIFNNGSFLEFDQSQLELQKIEYNSSNQQVDLFLSYYKRDFKINMLLDTQLADSDYVIAITERIKQLNVSKKMFLFQKTGENLNKVVKTEMYEWISDHLKMVEFKLNHKKIDVNLSLISLLAFKNQIEKEKKIVATIEYKNFSTNVDIFSTVVNAEKFKEVLQNKINTLNITADEAINYANIFTDANMKLIINQIITLLGSSIEIDNSQLFLNNENFESIAVNNQDKSELNPWVQKVNFKFRHKKSNLEFNSTVNFTYDKVEKEILFTNIFQNKINSNFKLTSGNDLLFLNLSNLKTRILTKLKDALNTDFSAEYYKFTFDYQQLNIYEYKVVKQAEKTFIQVFFKYGQIVTSTDRYIKIEVNTAVEFYHNNFEKIYQSIQKEIPEYPKETELRPDVNPDKAIAWINNKIKSTVKSIKINETDTEIEWEKFTFGINSSAPVHIAINGVNYFVFTLSYKDSRYGVEFKDSFYIRSPFQEIGPETTPIKIIFNFLKQVHIDMQLYFDMIHQTIIDDSSFKTLEERFKRLILPASSEAEEWKIMNFFGSLTNVYLDFLKESIVKLTNFGYSNFIFDDSKTTDPAVKRFQNKMEFLLKDDLKKNSAILNTSLYQQLFNEIDWSVPLKEGDYKVFFDKVYILNNGLIKDAIKYILK